MAETRYSDNDLQEFQALIEEKLAVARENYDELQRALSHSDDNTTDDTAPTFKMMEDGSETMSREETAQLAARQQKFIVNLENALLRIKNKTYGICRVTGSSFPSAPALGAPRYDVDRGQEQAVSNSLSTPRTLLGWVLAVVVPVLVADQCLTGVG